MYPYVIIALDLATSDPDIVLVFGKAAKGSASDANPTILNADFGATRVLDGTRFCMDYPPYETIVPLHLTCLYRREAALPENFYELSDFASFYQLMLGHKIGFVDSVAALWRQHGDNATAFLRFDQLRDDYTVLEKICQRAVAGGHFTREQGSRWLRQRTARFSLSMLKQTALGRYKATTALRMAPYLLCRNPTFIAELPASVMRKSGGFSGDAKPGPAKGSRL